MKYTLRKYIEYNNTVEDFISKTGTVFNSYEFLTSVGSNYRCYCVFDNNKIIGVLPIVKSSKYKVNSLNLPPLTYLYGPVVINDDYFLRKEIIESLLNEIKREDRIDFRCIVKSDDLKVYSDYGFEIIEKISHVFKREKLYGYTNISKTRKRYLKKLNQLLESDNIFFIEDKDSLLSVLKLWEKTAEYSNFNSNIEYLTKIVNSGIGIYANMITSADGTILSGTICPYDELKMYHLINASNREVEDKYKNTNTLSLFRAIKHANSLGLDFDFEGSNIDGVAKFYRSMGGERIKIYNFIRINSIYYKFIIFIKNWFKVKV